MSSFFSPFKRHAKSFNYKPRFYDPQKEEREQRRAELSGERRVNTDGGEEEYVPGQYLRTQFEARAQRRENRLDSGQKRMWSLIIGIALIFLVIALLYPRLAGIFAEAQQGRQPRPTKTELESEYGDFDPYAPITIVPNDYEEEQSE